MGEAPIFRKVGDALRPRRGYVVSHMRTRTCKRSTAKARFGLYEPRYFPAQRRDFM